jgi:tRNA A37 threonylcarbamoyladenosine dehydratase
MLNQFSRTELLVGKDGVKKLENAKVAIFGIGGVGGYTVEALVRNGVGAIDIIDDDKVCITNLNRQLIATQKTIGKHKVDVMKERILEINPKAIVNTYQCFYLPENAHEFNFTQYDYIVDAIDTITAKIEIIMRAKEHGIPVISCMGAGNRLDASKVVITDIYKTQMDPLARVMRRELRKRQVKSLRVVTSTEAPTRPSEDMALSCRDNCICPSDVERKCVERRDIPGSTSYVPAVAGLLLASEVIRDLLGVVKN